MISRVDDFLEEKELTIVGEARDGREGVGLARALDLDVAILDLAMPCVNCLDAAREIHRLFPFFFLAEDGIRGATVTGVQTCALPITAPRWAGPVPARWRSLLRASPTSRRAPRSGSSRTASSRGWSPPRPPSGRS